MGSIHFGWLQLTFTSCELLGKRLFSLTGKAVGLGGRPQLRGVLPAHTVQCSLLQQSEKFPATESRWWLLGLWGPFFQWDGWGQDKNKKAWRASGADTEQSAEITASQEDHSWDTEGVVQHFCSLKAEHCCIGNRSERDCSLRTKKRVGAVLFTNLLFEFQFTVSFSCTKKSSELWCGVSTMCNPAKPCILIFKALSTVWVLTSRKWSKEGHWSTGVPPLQAQEPTEICLVKTVIKVNSWKEDMSQEMELKY